MHHWSPLQITVSINVSIVDTDIENRPLRFSYDSEYVITGWIFVIIGQLSLRDLGDRFFFLHGPPVGYFCKNKNHSPNPARRDCPIVNPIAAAWQTTCRVNVF